MTQKFIGIVWRAGLDDDHDYTPADVLEAATAAYAARLPQPCGIDFDPRVPPLGVVVSAHYIHGDMHVEVEVSDEVWSSLMDHMTEGTKSVIVGKWVGDRLRPTLHYKQDTQDAKRTVRRLDKFDVVSVEACLNSEPVPLPKAETLKDVAMNFLGGSIETAEGVIELGPGTLEILPPYNMNVEELCMEAEYGHD